MEYLVFENSKGDKTLLTVSENRNETNKAIQKFLSDHNYTSHYWRLSATEDYTLIDVGSHTEFFYIFYEAQKMKEYINK